MQKDPIVQKVRNLRHELEQRYPDSESYYQHLLQQQKSFEGRLVRRSPKRSSRAQAS